MFLSVDPSTTCTGWAIFCETGRLITYSHEVHKGPLHARLGQLEALIHRLCYDMPIVCIVIESQFSGKNKSAGLAVARSAGAALVGFNRALMEKGGSALGHVVEIAPTSVKYTCTGMGHAKKERVRDAVVNILGVEPENSDEADALALGLTYLRKKEDDGNKD